MRRRLFTAWSLLSLVLCLTTVALGALSYHWRMEASGTWNYYSASSLRAGASPDYQRYHRLGVSSGTAYVQWLQSNRANPKRPIQKIIPGYPLLYPLHPLVSGFSYARTHWVQPTAASYYEFAFPLWILAALLAILPAWRFRHAWQRIRLEGHCANCGYNLTGNTSGVCPECGTTGPPSKLRKVHTSEKE